MALTNLSFRESLGEAFEVLGEEFPDLAIVTSDVGKSTKTAGFQKKYPERFTNAGIAEQNSIGIAAGLASVGYKALYTAYAMFAAGRPWEVIRNYICYPNLNVKIVASHGGINVGQDGVTHQATEDIAIMRALPNMKVLAVSDPGEVLEAIRTALNEPGPVYVRLGRASTGCLEHKQPWLIGHGETLRAGKDVTVFAIGLLVEKALLAADKLAQSGIECRVINMRSIKPIDQGLIFKAARETKLMVTAEDHNIYGGLFSAVSEVLAGLKDRPRLISVGIRDHFAESGNGLMLMEKYGLSESAIEKAVYHEWQQGGE
jgi:transketolase